MRLSDASEFTGESGNLAAPVHTLRRPRFWNVIILVILIVGMALSAVGAGAWYVHIQDQARAAFNTDASAVSAAVSTELHRDLDFVATQRAGVVAVPGLSNHELATWYATLNVKSRFPGGVGFAFVQRVLSSQLSVFGADVVADPPVNEPVTAPYSVFPAGQRSQYCLQRFGIATSAAAKAIPTTFDFCSSTIPPGNSPSPIPRLLEEATNTGQTTVLAAGKIAKTGGIADLFVVFAPVYTGDTTPNSVSTRQADLRGWIVATFSGNALLSADLGSEHGLAVRVNFDEPNSGDTTIASSGQRPNGSSFAHSLRVNADGSWDVLVVGSAQSNATVQAIGVGVIGVGMILLLVLLFALLTRSRTMALRLVDKRTRQLRHLALHDPLTDLPNRALILDRAEQMLLRARRHPLLVGALFIDLDKFKEVNDTFGHATGDLLLKAVGARLSGVLRASDSVGRLGGDEFVVLVEGELGGDGPEIVAQQLLAKFAQPFVLEGSDVGPVRVSASIGVAVGPRSGAADLLRDADVALYVAKARGEHGYVLFRSEMHTILSDRLAFERGPDDGKTPDESRDTDQRTFELNDSAAIDLSRDPASPLGGRSRS